MATAIIEVSTFSKIPGFVPFGVLYYTQDTGDLYIGTGSSQGPAVDAVSGGSSFTASGTTSIATTALTNVSSAPNGDVIVADGSGNVKDSGVLLSSLLTSVTWDELGNAAGNLTLANGTYSTTFNQTDAAVWQWANTTTATGSTTNASPSLELAANYYTGSASAQDLWTLGSALAAGTNGKSLLSFTHSGSTGAAQVSFPASSGVPGIVFNGGTIGIGVGVGTSVQIETGRFSLQLHDATDSATYGIMNGNTNGNGFTIQCGVTNGAVYLGASSGFMNPYTANNAIAVSMGGDLQGNSVPFQGTTSSGLQTNISETCTFSPASGSTSFVAHNIAPTINASGSSGNFTALKINPTMTAAPTGTNLLLDLQVGGTSKFSVSTVGALQMSAASGAPTSAGTAGTAGEIIYYSGLLYFCSVTGAAGSATWNKLSMTAV